MATNTDRAIAKLLRETQDGTLSWRIAERSDSRPSVGDGTITALFFAEREGRQLRLCRFSVQHSYDGDEWFTRDCVRLDLGDGRGVAWWTFPESQVTSDLADAIERQVADADGFFKEILGE